MGRPRGIGRWRGAALAAVAAAAARAVGQRFARFEIAEASMAPALQPGDYVLAVRRRRPLRRGDVVVFVHPALPGMSLVKRVVGLPGEKVAIRAGRVFAGGRPEEAPGRAQTTRPDGEWRLGPDEVFVLGDARAASASDSRQLGPVPVAALEARLLLRYWPPRTPGRR